MSEKAQLPNARVRLRQVEALPEHLVDMAHQLLGLMVDAGSPVAAGGAGADMRHEAEAEAVPEVRHWKGLMPFVGTLSSHGHTTRCYTSSACLLGSTTNRSRAPPVLPRAVQVSPLPRFSPLWPRAIVLRFNMR